jgi:aminoglycoside/choline kinase family phosphotransferase
VEKHPDDLKHLFRQWSGEEGIDISAIPSETSDRQYYRLTGQSSKAIGVYNPDRRENKSFISFTKTFLSLGLHVPELFAKDEQKCIYLLQDLGNTTLLDKLEKERKKGRISSDTESMYKLAIEELVRFQLIADKKIDYNICYPSKEFDERTIRWHLNYFKYNFLRLLKVNFNEYQLENDFETLTRYALQTENNFFMYRDFQARNILIHEGIPWFIDYQGGCRGPLQFDLASLLFQVKADLPFEFREEMLKYYISILSNSKQVDKEDFIKRYYVFVLVRLLQVMGAYGFHGYFERRQHFLKSIPYAIKNVNWLLRNVSFNIPLETLLKCLRQIASVNVQFPADSKEDILTIWINSFAYKNGTPFDYSGNGGGFIFDCRLLPDTEQYEHYKPFTGKDSLVIEFLQYEPAVNKFMQSVYKLIDQTVVEYQHQRLNNLQVNFGSSNGKHRSVYCAEKLANYLEEKYSVRVVINHIELLKESD